MRTTLILAMFTASLAQAGWNDFQEVRELKLDAAGITSLAVDAGAGSLEINGISGADQILVTATITVPGKSDEKAQTLIDSDLVLTLEKEGGKAILKAHFDNDGWGWGDSPSVRLDVSVPDQLSLDVDDSSGSITIKKVFGDIDIDDSSGSIKMTDVGGSVRIDDGSGSIKVSGVGGDLSVEDGSGSVTVTHVKGSVTIDDGSGSVNVKDVGKDLIIISDGSGSINYSDVQGSVDDRS